VPNNNAGDAWVVSMTGMNANPQASPFVAGILDAAVCTAGERRGRPAQKKTMSARAVFLKKRLKELLICCRSHFGRA
jgi:hypothetical protein